MRKALRIPALLAALVMTPSVGYGFDLCRLLGLGCGDAYRCGCDAGYGCEPDCGCGGCGCGDCGCDAGCGCEPSCGCGDGCGCDGRQFAGQVWECCHECGPPISPCTGPECCGCEPSCGCGDCGEPACGCGCDEGCGCEPSCGCGSSCGCGTSGSNLGCGFGQCCGRVVGFIDRLCGCTGCDGELYWSEWHNDPPRCCDPCDHCGNWVGPGYGYRAPYDHSHPANGYVAGAYHARGEATTPRTTVARGSRPNATQGAARPAYIGQQIKPAPPARQSVRPATRTQAPARGQVTRKPNMGPNSTYQR